MITDQLFDIAEVDIIFHEYIVKKNRVRNTARAVKRREADVRNLLIERGWLRALRVASVNKKKYYTPSPGAPDLASLNSTITLVGNFTAERIMFYVSHFGSDRIIVRDEVSA